MSSPSARQQASHHPARVIARRLPPCWVRPLYPSEIWHVPCLKPKPSPNLIGPLCKARRQPLLNASCFIFSPANSTRQRGSINDEWVYRRGCKNSIACPKLCTARSAPEAVSSKLADTRLG